MADSHKNFSYSTVATAPSPADSGTSLVVQSGDGTKFPTVPFNATVWPVDTQPTVANAEIVRVTNISTDTFTITRTQESTSARTIVIGDQIAATITNKTFTDIEELLASPAANTVLQGTSTTAASFTTSPKIPSIKDTGNTTRITLATSGNNVAVSGQFAVTDEADDTTTMSVNVTGGTATSKKALDFPSTVIFPSGNSHSYTVVSGTPKFRQDDTSSGHSVTGLAFDPAALPGGSSVTLTLTSMIGIQVRPGGLSSVSTNTTNITTMKGLYIISNNLQISGTVAVTTYMGIHIDNQNTATISNWTGIQIDDETGATGNIYLLNVGDTPNFRVVGKWTAAANQTPVYIAEGVTPTLKQLKTLGTKEVWIEPFEGPKSATLDDWAYNNLSSVAETTFIFHAPADFLSFSSVNIVMIPDATETIQADLDVSVAAVGEDYNADTRQSVDQTTSVTINDITEWDISGIGSLFTGVAAEDYVSIRFQSDTSSLQVLGCRVVYNTNLYTYLS